MTTYTPGPWAISKVRYRGQDISIMATRRNGNLQRIGRVYNAGILANSDPEAEANASLVTAAPDLLGALDIAQATIERLHVRHGPVCMCVNGSLDVIKAARAKAKGG